MDYNELLFAHHVRKEILNRISPGEAELMTQEEMNVRIDELVESIVKSTVNIANRIKKVQASLD